MGWLFWSQTHLGIFLLFVCLFLRLLNCSKNSRLTYSSPLAVVSCHTACQTDWQHCLWECYYHYLSSLMTQIPFYAQHPFMSLLQFFFWCLTVGFFFFFFSTFLFLLGHTIVVCYRDNLVLDFNKVFNKHRWTFGYHPLWGLVEKQGPTRTIIMDIPLNEWKKKDQGAS